MFTGGAADSNVEPTVALVPTKLDDVNAVLKGPSGMIIFYESYIKGEESCDDGWPSASALQRRPALKKLFF